MSKVKENTVADVLVISSKHPLYTQLQELSGDGHAETLESTHSFNVLKSSNGKIYVAFPLNYISQVDEHVIDDDLGYIKGKYNLSGFHWTRKPVYKEGGGVGEPLTYQEFNKAYHKFYEAEHKWSSYPSSHVISNIYDEYLKNPKLYEWLFKYAEEGGVGEVTSLIIPYNNSLSGTKGVIDLSKSREEFGKEMAKNYALENKKRVTPRMIENFTSDAGAYHRVRDILEGIKTNNFNDVIKVFKEVYPKASKDWRSALVTGLVIKAKEREGNYSDKPFIYNDEIAEGIREKGINFVQPIIDQILSGSKATGGGVEDKNPLQWEVWTDGKQITEFPHNLVTDEDIEMIFEYNGKNYIVYVNDEGSPVYPNKQAPISVANNNMASGGKAKRWIAPKTEKEALENRIKNMVRLSEQYKDILKKFKKAKSNTIDGKFYSPNDLRWMEEQIPIYESEVKDAKEKIKTVDPNKKYESKMEHGGETQSKEKLKEIIANLKTAISIDTTPESTKESMRKKLSELEEKLQKSEAEELRVKLNTEPNDIKYWIDIEEKYNSQVRNALFHEGKKGSIKPYTVKVTDRVARIFLKTEADLNHVLKIYNERRAKKGDSAVAKESVTGTAPKTKPNKKFQPVKKHPSTVKRKIKGVSVKSTL